MEEAASILDFLQEEVLKLPLMMMRLTSAVVPCSNDAELIASEPGTLAKYQIVLGKPNTSPENKHARLIQVPEFPQVRIVEKVQVP